MKPHVNPFETVPAGIARMRVRRLIASISASATRLKAIAADRAATIATTIHANFPASSLQPRPLPRTANNAPVNAKGSAKTECSNLIISSTVRVLERRAIANR